MISSILNPFHIGKWTYSKTAIDKKSHSFHTQALSYTEAADPPDSTQTRVWQEFVTGMQMLNQHITRINADVTQIVRSNLRLLHTNLQTTEPYKDLIEMTKQTDGNESLLSRWPIISTQQVQGSLIRINHDIERSPHLATHICYDYFNASDDFQGLEPATSLFFVLSGKICVEYRSELNQLVSNADDIAQREESITTRVIKSGDVLINPQHQDNLIRVSNKHKNTLLLAIHIAHKQL